MANTQDQTQPIEQALSKRLKPLLNDIAVDISAGLYEVHERIDDLADAISSQQTDTTIVLQVVQQLSKEVCSLQQTLIAQRALLPDGVPEPLASRSWLQSTLRL